MFRLWGKLVKGSKTLRDTVIEDSSSDTRTHKILNGLTEICYQFDLSVPIWLDSNIADFKHRKKTRFTSDNFIVSMELDFLELSVLEEDGY